MENKQTPLKLERVSESIYAGFWLRLASLFIDAFFLFPVIMLIQYINSHGINMYLYTIFPQLLLLFWYHVYLPRRYGGTAGKLVVGIKIIRTDGQPIAWKEAILRYIVTLIFTIFNVMLMIYCLRNADEETYMSLGWLKKTEYLMLMSPLLFKIYMWSSNIWEFSELIVLLTNNRKRAIHDYIAGTVIVKAIYIDRIREVMKIESEKIAGNESVPK